MLDEQDEIDHDNTDRPVCPYCGHEHKEGAEYHGSESTTRISCTECGETFESEQEISVTYSTSKIDFVKEEAEKQKRAEETAARHAACQKFTPGTRVRIKSTAKWLWPRYHGVAGVVANRELQRHNPFVHIKIEGAVLPAYPEDVELA
jgi:transcription elongation factor Elf1